MERIEQWTQAYTQAPWRRQVQAFVLFTLIAVFLGLIAFIYIDVTTRAATIGRQIQIAQDEIDVVQRANTDLQTQLAELTSASVMEQRAEAQGFVKIGKDEAIFLVVSGYRPRQQAELAPARRPVEAVAAALPVEYTEPLVLWFMREVWPVMKDLVPEFPKFDQPILGGLRAEPASASAAAAEVQP
jgi:cell division protein FtsL